MATLLHPWQTSLINGLPSGWGPDAGLGYPPLGPRKSLPISKDTKDSKLMRGIKSPQTTALPASDLEHLVLN